MHHLSKPADRTDTEGAEYRVCEADAADLGGQTLAREAAYERGEITREEYDNWEYDYSPREGADTGTGPAAPEPVPGGGLPDTVPKWWPQRHGLRVSSGEDGDWAVWGHHDERRVAAAVIADARADGVLNYLHEYSGLAGLLAGIARRWVNDLRETDDGTYWKYCPPGAEGAVAITIVSPCALTYPPETLADLFAERARDAAADAVHHALVEGTRRCSGESQEWMAGYSEGIEHVLESLRLPGTTATKFLATLPYAWPRHDTTSGQE